MYNKLPSSTHIVFPFTVLVLIAFAAAQSEYNVFILVVLLIKCSQLTR